MHASFGRWARGIPDLRGRAVSRALAHRSAGGPGSQRFSSRRFLIGTGGIVLTSVTAHQFERSGRFAGDDSLASGVVAAVRFTRALGVSTAIMVNYRLLFARHQEYSSDEYKKDRSSVHEKSAARLLELCKTQGAVYVKIGQHVASMNHAVPREFTSKLSELEDRAAFRSYSEVERVLRQELGAEVKDVFASFDHEPVAAASLAQVHRAVLAESGEVVACKVQYPGLATLVGGDLFSIRLLSSLLTFVFPFVSLDWIVNQFRENLSKELDFLQEAACSERTRLFFESDNRVSVPRIIQTLTTSRVLTMEYIDGFRIDDRERLRESNVNSDTLAWVIVNAFGRMVFESGFVHCDGHPGNMLVRPRMNSSGKMTGDFELFLLDHGLYKELSEEFRLAYCRLWRGFVLRRTSEVDKACELLGAPGLANVFSIFLLNRNWSSAKQVGVDLRNKMSKEEMRELMRELRSGGLESGADVAELLGNVPSDLLLVFKMNSLVRNVNKLLGARVDRFRLNARNAVRGLHIKSEGAVPDSRVVTTRPFLPVLGVFLNAGQCIWRAFTDFLYRPVCAFSDMVVVELNLLFLDALFAAVQLWRGRLPWIRSAEALG